MKAVVLGCGLVGNEIARDLARDNEFEVTAADINSGALSGLGDVPGVTTVETNLADRDNLIQLVKEHDIAVLAVPGFMGYQTLEAAIDSGKHIVDICFTPEGTLQLHDRAKDAGVIAVVDCGVAPGLSHVLVANASSKMDNIELAAIYAGGLPAEPEPPWRYKAVFSPLDVIEEYIRPARTVRDGNVHIVDALSEVEFIQFPEVGTLEAFATDGLRSLLTTIKAENMYEKTLRYPGHAEKMQALREAGMFGKDAIEVGGVAVKPIEVISKLLFPSWKLHEGEEDLTVLRVIVKGTKGDQTATHVYNLLDYYDRERQTTSMARTTGYMATSVVRLIRDGVYTRVGVSPPEYLGMEAACFDALREHLAQRGIVVRGA
jgi:lysine 6-dehydrogenase